MEYFLLWFVFMISNCEKNSIIVNVINFCFDVTLHALCVAMFPVKEWQISVTMVIITDCLFYIKINCCGLISCEKPYFQECNWCGCQHQKVTLVTIYVYCQVFTPFKTLFELISKADIFKLCLVFPFSHYDNIYMCGS